MLKTKEFGGFGRLKLIPVFIGLSVAKRKTPAQFPDLRFFETIRVEPQNLGLSPLAIVIKTLEYEFRSVASGQEAASWHCGRCLAMNFD